MIDWTTYAKTGKIQDVEFYGGSPIDCIKTATPIKSITAYAEKIGYDRRTIYRWFKDERWMFDTVLLGVSIRLKAEQIDRIVGIDAGLSIRDLPSEEDKNG